MMNNDIEVDWNCWKTTYQNEPVCYLDAIRFSYDFDDVETKSEKKKMRDSPILECLSPVEANWRILEFWRFPFHLLL